MSRPASEHFLVDEASRTDPAGEPGRAASVRTEQPPQGPTLLSLLEVAAAGPGLHGAAAAGFDLR